jgi:murein DD-endopeptidase MepM/ murein hydrolase activator NlpD
MTVEMVRRVDRRRSERRRRTLLTAGLSFAIGALSATALSWRLDESDLGAPPAAVMSETEAEIAALESGSTDDGRDAPGDPAPAHDPAEPRGAQRPGEDGEPAAAATTGSVAHGAAVESLRDRRLRVPVDGVDRDDLRDTFSDARGARAHEAIDIMAPRGTPVRAVEDGRVAKLFTSAAGGTTIYMFDPTETYCYYYAHLDRYAAGLREGQAVERGDVIGYVGSTGNASPNAPHLHFAIFRMTSEKQWWKGEPINPYPVLK